MAWFYQSTDKPRPNPPTASTGGSIEVEFLHECPFGASCHRERWWVQAYDQGGEIHKNRYGKPAKHYHVKERGTWWKQ